MMKETKSFTLRNGARAKGLTEWLLVTVDYYFDPALPRGKMFMTYFEELSNFKTAYFTFLPNFVVFIMNKQPCNVRAFVSSFSFLMLCIGHLVICKKQCNACYGVKM